MSERGVFAIDRGVWEHPMFAREPFTEREAWMWLCGAAAWAPKRVRVGRGTFELGRGQCAFATRFLAERWRWDHSRVSRFLKRLKTDTMVHTSATREATLITICNYDKYAFGRNTSDTPTDTPTEQPPKHSRHKEEETNKQKNEEIKKQSRAVALDDDWPSDYGDQFWQAYPRKSEKLATMKRLATLRKSGIVTFVDLMAGVKRYAASVANNDPKYTKQPPAWLNAGCWADEIPTGGSNGNRIINAPRRPAGADFFAGMSSVAADIDGNCEPSGPAGEAVPLGRVNIDG